MAKMEKMLEFREERMILTGINSRISKNTGEEYKIINFLGENGQTFGCMAECDIPLTLKQLDEVSVHFKVLPGRYTQLRVLDIKKVS